VTDRKFWECVLCIAGTARSDEVPGKPLCTPLDDVIHAARAAVKWRAAWRETLRGSFATDR
jgi:hypothetical protein